MPFGSSSLSPDNSTIVFNSEGQISVSGGIVSGALSAVFQEHIRRLIGGATTYGKDTQDIWGEAYIDANGRNDAVDTTNTDSTFSSNKYTSKPSKFVASGGTIVKDATSGLPFSVSGNFVNDTNAFDGNDATEATFTGSGGNYGSINSIGKTWATPITITAIRIKATGKSELSPQDMTLYSYNGATWDVVQILSTGSSKTHSFDGVVTPATPILNCLGIGLSVPVGAVSPSVGHVYTIGWTSKAYAEVIHTIPTGTYPANVSSALFKTLVADYEAGVSITYELINATETSGVVLDGVSSSFTAFTSEPTTLKIRLIPKSSSPTAGYPAIFGVAGKAW